MIDEPTIGPEVATTPEHLCDHEVHLRIERKIDRLLAFFEVAAAEAQRKIDEEPT